MREKYSMTEIISNSVTRNKWNCVEKYTDFLCSMRCRLNYLICFQNIELDT